MDGKRKRKALHDFKYAHLVGLSTTFVFALFSSPSLGQSQNHCKVGEQGDNFSLDHCLQIQGDKVVPKSYETRRNRSFQATKKECKNHRVFLRILSYIFGYNKNDL